MTQEEFGEAVAGCTHFLQDHYYRSAEMRMQEIADSEHCKGRPDHYGRGHFVNRFEAEIADLLGKEAAVFMPSGTMAQQIALRIWSDRAQNPTVAFHPCCHLHTHEEMAYRELHHLVPVLLGEPDRLFTLEDLKAAERALSSLLIELPQRDLGGQLPSWDELTNIASFAKGEGIRLHADGARLWECQPYYGRPYREIVADFDSVYVSFYKILFGLPGAALAGPADFVAEARVWMRRHGGNLVHMFPNVVSAKIGVDLRLPRIPSYVAKAGEVASILEECPQIGVVPAKPPTNMMHLYFEASPNVVMDAVGQVAKTERCLLLRWAKEVRKGSMAELWIGDAGLDIKADRLKYLLGQLDRLLECSTNPE
jgi:threonine aldolase